MLSKKLAFWNKVCLVNDLLCLCCLCWRCLSFRRSHFLPESRSPRWWVFPFFHLQLLQVVTIPLKTMVTILKNRLYIGGVLSQLLYRKLGAAVYYLLIRSKISLEDVVHAAITWLHKLQAMISNLFFTKPHKITSLKLRCELNNIAFLVRDGPFFTKKICRKHVRVERLRNLGYLRSNIRSSGTIYLVLCTVLRKLVW